MDVRMKEMMSEMTEEEQLQAARMQRIAQRAEEKAKQRQLEREMKEKQEKQQLQASTASKIANHDSDQKAKPVFLTKKQREALALERLKKKREEQNSKAPTSDSKDKYLSRDRDRRRDDRKRSYDDTRRRGDDDKEAKILEEIKAQYLGGKKQKKKITKPSEKFAKIFKFKWDEDEDTSADLNSLYSNKATVQPLYGRGFVGGVDKKAQRQNSTFMSTLLTKRHKESSSSSGRGESSHESHELEKKLSALKKYNKNYKDKHDQSAGPTKHWKDKELVEMTVRDWRIVREDHDIYVKGGRIPHPARNWKELNLPSAINKAIKDAGYKQPSPIQMQAIPIGLAYRDIIGVAQTGSGKTCAFVVPMLDYITKNPAEKLAACSEEGPLAVIMAPTRELAQQIEGETIKMARYMSIKTVTIIGGTSAQEQTNTVRRGVEVIVATPGRLLDLIESRLIVLNQCNYIVLDEADRMIDMGFEPQVESVLKSMNCGQKADTEEEVIIQEKKATLGDGFVRTTIMFSATMPPSVERLAQKYMKFPAIIRIGDVDSGKNKNIEQHVYMVTENQKRSKCLELVRKSSPPIIVFMNSKSTCDTLSNFFNKNGHRSVVLHSGKSQDIRVANLEQFKTGKSDILVATDVAGRGLDIDDVSHVINYDMAKDIERYCHRIGRTGRAGKSGKASTLLTEDDSELFYALSEYLKSTKTAVPTELAKHPLNVKPGEVVDRKFFKKS